MITIQNLVKNYGQKTVVNIGRLNIRAGETIGLVETTVQGRQRFSE